MNNNPENNVPHEVMVITPKGKKRHSIPSGSLVRSLQTLGGVLTSVNDHPVAEQTDQDVSSYPILPKQTDKVQ